MNNRNRTIVGGGMYQDFMNYTLPNSINKLKSGERHPPMWSNNGFQIPSFLGPGTDLVEKIKSGIEPINDSDKTAMAHDIRYHIAKDNTDIRKADERMITALNNIEKRKSDYKYNIYTGKLPIQAKMFLENMGLAKTENFTTYGEVEEEDRKMFEDKLASLTAEGYGMNRY
jgi:hypothetical protein